MYRKEIEDLKKGMDKYTLLTTKKLDGAMIGIRDDLDKIVPTPEMLEALGVLCLEVEKVNNLALTLMQGLRGGFRDEG